VSAYLVGVDFGRSMKKFTFDGGVRCQIPNHVLPANHVLLVQSGVLDSFDLQAKDRARANEEVVMVRLKPKYTDGLKRDKSRTETQIMKRASNV